MLKQFLLLFLLLACASIVYVGADSSEESDEGSTELFFGSGESNSEVAEASEGFGLLTLPIAIIRLPYDITVGVFSFVIDIFDFVGNLILAIFLSITGGFGIFIESIFAGFGAFGSSAAAGLGLTSL